jgi:hypothetical protein
VLQLKVGLAGCPLEEIIVQCACATEFGTTVGGGIRPSSTADCQESPTNSRSVRTATTSIFEPQEKESGARSRALVLESSSEGERLINCVCVCVDMCVSKDIYVLVEAIGVR